MDRLQRERAGREIAEEAGLRLPADSRPEQVGDFGDDQRRNDERTGVCLQQFETGNMVRVVGVDVRVERAGVDDQRDGDSARMISSTRGEMSLRPLRPAAAAPNRRREPLEPR